MSRDHAGILSRESDASRVAAIAAMRRRAFRMQQFLYFLPLPQGQGSLRPTLRLAVADRLELLRRPRCRRSRPAAARSISLRRRRFFLDRCGLDPGAADEAFVELLHLEDQVGHVVADRDPHRARTAACLRACTRPWDRPGRSRAGRRWTAGGPSPADALSRPCRGSAGAAPAPSAASRGGSGLRRAATTLRRAASRSSLASSSLRELAVAAIRRARSVRSIELAVVAGRLRRACASALGVARTAVSTRCCASAATCVRPFVVLAAVLDEQLRGFRRAACS